MKRKMMFTGKSTIRLGKVLGIPIGLHWSWFFIFALVTGSLSAGYYPTLLPGHPWQYYWLLGTATSLLFFLSVLAHEFGHALVALHDHLPVTGISLLVFGGVAQIGQEPRTPGEEFWIAIAGPATSLAAGLAFGLAWLLFRSYPAIAAPAEWLARINLALLAFNMIPGFPLDGGRVFRAILWAVTKSRRRATRFAGYGSQAIAFGFIGVGLFSAFGGNFANAIWLVFVGWFLENTTASYSEQAGMDDAVGHVRVMHVMNRDFRAIPADTSLSTLQERSSNTTTALIYFLYDGNRICGMLTAGDLANSLGLLASTTARQAMTPLRPEAVLRPDYPLLAALAWMDNSGLAAVPVMQDGLLTGFLAREQVVSYIRARRAGSE
jgi:Zn-dependent protease